MNECSEKVLVDLTKYNNLKEANNELATELKRVNQLIEKEKGFFQLCTYRGPAYYNQDEFVSYFKSVYSVKFYNSLKNTAIDQKIKGLENLLKEYENKMLDLFKIIVHRGKERDVFIHLGENFYSEHMQKLNKVHDSMRKEIIKEESELIENEKINKLQSKIDKIPFWIKIIFNIN